MKIAFDTLPAFPGKSGAVGAFRKWMQIIPALRAEMHIYLFVFPEQKEYYKNFIPETMKERIHFIVIRLPSKLIFRIIVQNFFIPVLCWHQKIDVHISLNPEPWIRLSQTLEVFKIADLQYLESPDEFGFLKYHYRKILGSNKINKSDLIIANSTDTKNKILKYFKIPSKKVIIIPESYDDEFFTTIQGLVNDSEIIGKYEVHAPFLLYVSSFRPYKNHYDLLAAFKLLADRINHQIILVGNDINGYKSSVLEMIENFGISKRVIILDYIHHWELASFYRQADAFIYPSKLETFGIPPLEAMACGCPVITSNYSCIPEIVGEGAEIVITNNHNEFAEKIYQVINNKSLRADLIRRGKNWCVKYSWKKNSESMLEEIEKRLFSRDMEKS